MLWQRTLQCSTKLCKTQFLKPQFAVAIAGTKSQQRIQQCFNYSTSSIGLPNGLTAEDAKKLGVHRWSSWTQIGDHGINYDVCSDDRDVVHLHQHVTRSTAALEFPHNDETATGTIISPDGYIVTCAHALGSPDEIPALTDIEVMVTLNGETNSLSQEAEVVAVDYGYDVAILKVKTKRFLDLPKFRNVYWSKESSYGLPRLTYFGRVKHREGVCKVVAKKCQVVRNEGDQKDESSHKKWLIRLAPDSLHYVREDDPIDIWRNYGGPLVDDNGNVVGVLNNAEPGCEYAVPSEVIFRMLRQSQVFGRIIRPSIGVDLDEFDRYGFFRIKEVLEGLAAHKAGIKQGETIEMVNDQPISNLHQFGEQLSFSRGQPVKLTIRDREYYRTRIVEVLPEDPTQAELECYKRYLEAVGAPNTNSSESEEDQSSSDDDDDDDGAPSERDDDEGCPSERDDDDSSSGDDDNSSDDDNSVDDDVASGDEQKADDMAKEIKEQEYEQPKFGENMEKTNIGSRLLGPELEKMAKDVEMIHKLVLDMGQKFQTYSADHGRLEKIEEEISKHSMGLRRIESDMRKMTGDAQHGSKGADLSATISNLDDRIADLAIKMDSIDMGFHSRELEDVREDLREVVRDCQSLEEELKNKANVSTVNKLKWQVSRIRRGVEE